MKQYITEKGMTFIKNKKNKLSNLKKNLIEEKQTFTNIIGDQSENFEYLSLIEQLDQTEKSILKYNRIIENDVVIKESDIVSTPGTVRFGSKVKVENVDTGEVLSLNIVGTDELEVDKLNISNISPMGSTLLNKEIEDTVIVNGQEYEILTVDKITSIV